MRMVYKSEMDKPEYRGPKRRYWAGFNILPATVGEVPLLAAATAGLLGNFRSPAVFSNQFAVIVESIWAYMATDVAPDLALLTNGITATFLANGKRVMDNVLLALLPSDAGLQEAVAIPAAAVAAVQVGAHRGPRYNMGSWKPLVAKGEAIEASFNIPVALAGLPVGGVITSLWFEVRAIGYIKEE